MAHSSMPRVPGGSGLKLYSTVDARTSDDVSHLGMVTSAAALARTLLDVDDTDEVITLRSGLVRLAARSVVEVISGFEHNAWGSLADGISSKHERIVSTVRNFLVDGSVQATADRLFVHRNTVFKRLQIFHDLTEFDVMRPYDAAVAQLLLAQFTDVGLHPPPKRNRGQLTIAPERLGV